MNPINEQFHNQMLRAAAGAKSLADTFKRMNAVIKEWARITLELEAQLCRERVRRLLGYDDDASAPGWVLRLHEQQVEQFGTGNGRQ